VSTSGTPLKKLKEMLGQYKIGVTSGANGFPGNFPPFVGGAVGMFSYDFVHYFERLPRTTTDDLRIPDAHFLLVDTVAAFDHKSKKTFIISCSAAEETGFSFGPVDRDPGTYYESACDKINSLYKKISSKNNADLKSSGKPEKRIRIQHATGENDYIEMVKRAKDYIKAGDIFQANLSQRVSADISRTGPWDIYKTLSRINPSPFAVYLDMGDYQIVSSSPERLVKFSGNTVETRPIAGTRPRGRNAKADRKMRADLLINEKERAEHLMLIDLERNDLGKISDYGSVTVDELMITEDYSHVIHIVSNIKGTAAKGKDCFDAIRATFPGGTITGVPKVRCMEIIDELETVTRGPYTGSLGYISLTGSMDMNIIIRTFVIKNGIAYVQAGAGIVADSDPKKEYGETLKKAEALIKTLEML
ncbi:MAG TPA: anthranilate synthase component I family protein, partial [Nitrospirae bacterium]|nr:anthranilate synthase component I family protein [Nitrospirota bacterium]